jgi:hypothetical protein
MIKQVAFGTPLALQGIQDFEYLPRLIALFLNAKMQVVWVNTNPGRVRLSNVFIQFVT